MSLAGVKVDLVVMVRYSKMIQWRHVSFAGKYLKMGLMVKNTIGCLTWSGPSEAFLICG